jgi:citrate lyase subunit beta/citryl-CoA lyase
VSEASSRAAVGFNTPEDARAGMPTTRRSLLFTPGDRGDRLRKAPEFGADIVCFDLEDGVAPGAKADARETVHEVLADPAFDPDTEVCVRLTPDAATDLDVVVDGDVRLDAVQVPKVESAGDVEEVATLLREAGRSVPVFALVETARGVLAADEIAAAAPTAMLCFGAEDLTADLGAEAGPDRAEVAYARQRTLLAARAGGAMALDTPYVDYEDEAGLRDDAADAVALGYDGKAAIHPVQVDTIHEAFAPDPGRVAWAERVLAARDEAEGGVATVDGEMVDAPVFARAERVLARAGDRD